MSTYFAARRILNGTVNSESCADGLTCAVCGATSSGIKLGEVVSDNFTTWDLVSGDRSANCCMACEAVFRDFRFRNKSLVATCDGVQAADAAAFRAAILDGTQIQVMTWPSSRKKHCWLHAGVSDAETLRIGCDDQQATFRRNDAAGLFATIERLFEIGATKLEVRSGMYRHIVMQRLGYEYDDVEERLRPARVAGILEILVWCCEREAGSGKGEIAVLTPEDPRALNK